MCFNSKKISTELNIKAPKLIERTKREAATITAFGDYSKIDYSSLWNKLWPFIKKNKLFSMRMEFLGIYSSDPTTTPANECKFDACITITRKIEDTDEIKIKEIEGGKFLMFLYKGSYDNLGKVYDFIYNDYLKDKGYKFRNALWMEKYLNNPNNTPAHKLKTEIYIPIE
jgi:AraC family transcriptional regulator